MSLKIAYCYVDCLVGHIRSYSNDLTLYVLRPHPPYVEQSSWKKNFCSLEYIFELIVLQLSIIYFPSSKPMNFISYTYIIGHYNPSFRILDLVSNITYVVCVNFIHKRRGLQLKVDSERQIF